MSNLNKAPAWFVFSLFGVVVAGFVGWVLNLIAVFNLTTASPLGWIIGRLLGIFVPFIGAILGYI